MVDNTTAPLDSKIIQKDTKASKKPLDPEHMSFDQCPYGKYMARIHANELLMQHFSGQGGVYKTECDFSAKTMHNLLYLIKEIFIEESGLQDEVVWIAINKFNEIELCANQKITLAIPNPAFKSYKSQEKPKIITDFCKSPIGKQIIQETAEKFLACLAKSPGKRRVSVEAKEIKRIFTDEKKRAYDAIRKIILPCVELPEGHTISIKDNCVSWDLIYLDIEEVQKEKIDVKNDDFIKEETWLMHAGLMLAVVSLILLISVAFFEGIMSSLIQSVLIAILCSFYFANWMQQPPSQISDKK